LKAVVIELALITENLVELEKRSERYGVDKGSLVLSDGFAHIKGILEEVDIPTPQFGGGPRPSIPQMGAVLDGRY
jgi:hypothetical protein